MKNFFDYFPNEKYQDVFLRWVLDNHADPELSTLVCEFVELLTNGGLKLRPGDIKMAFAPPQIKGIDIVYKIMTAEGKEHLLVIEDKVNAKVSQSQLGEYNLVISERWPSISSVFKCCYKTTQPTKSDIKLIKQNGWYYVPLDEILKFWQRQKEITANLFVQHYYDHILSIDAEHAEVIGISDALKSIVARHQKEHQDSYRIVKTEQKKWDYYLWIDKFSAGMMKGPHWKGNPIWVDLTLYQRQGLLRLYCGAPKHTQRIFEFPEGFTKSNRWKKYDAAEFVIGTPSDVLTKEGRESLYRMFEYAIGQIAKIEDPTKK